MRIKLKYPDVETFIQKYAVNISRGGIFIATKQPKPVGTYVKFEFLLSNTETQSIIRGEGQVQWTKEFDAKNPGKPHGMGVKFLRLDSESQQVIDRALRWRAEHGTSPNARLPTAGSSAHAMVTTDTGPKHLADLADTDDATTKRRREGEDSSDDWPTAVRDPSQSGRLPKASVPPPVPQAAVAPPPIPQAPAPPPPVPQTAVPVTETTAVQAMPPEMEPLPAPAPSTGRREETRPIAIAHDDDAPPARARHETTRPIELGASRKRDEIDALASEWGLTDEKLARILKRARPRIVEATAELERLLLKPPKAPAPSKAEAREKLAALLAKRPGTREPNGERGQKGAAHGAGDHDEAEPRGDGVSAGARTR
jgi:uncharacterized protein (TIGR02266 family)